MTNDEREKIYLTKHYSFFEKILIKKRREILIILKEFLNKKKEINDILDVGTTEDEKNESSNYLVKNLLHQKYTTILIDQKNISNQ